MPARPSTGQSPSQDGRATRGTTAFSSAGAPHRNSRLGSHASSPLMFNTTRTRLDLVNVSSSGSTKSRSLRGYTAAGTRKLFPPPREKLDQDGNGFGTPRKGFSVS